MTEPDDVHGYPHHLAGEPTIPPQTPAPRLLEMAVRAREREVAAAADDATTELLAAANWRHAASLDVLLGEANTAAPNRSKRSDGRIADARHMALGRASDHVPWLVYKGQGICRAADLTNDPALQLAAAFERARVAAYAGRLPQLLNGGYLILDRKITAPDFSCWLEFTGAPHVSHGHASVSLNPAQFDSRAAWGIFTTTAPPAPAPARPPGGGSLAWTGPDLTGTGPGLRGQAAGQPQGPQTNGPRFQALQRWLRENYGLYAKHLDPDGWYGTETAGVLAEFAHRSGIPESDGLNIGPKLAGALHRAGFDRRLSAAQARVLGHVQRTARR